MNRVARLDYEDNSAYAIDRLGVLLVVAAVVSLFSLPLNAFAQQSQVTVYPNRYYTAELGGAGTTTKQIYAGNMLIATVETVGGKSTIRYVHPDALNSTNVVSDAKGSVVETTDYYPYGQVRLDEMAGYSGENRKFIGQVYDPETQLSYLNARYYSGARGQFLSQDPQFWTTKQKLEDPQSLNSYAYAEDNPITKSDPTGLLTVVVPGTRWDWKKQEAMCMPSSISTDFLAAVGKTFHETPMVLNWDGKDTSAARTEAATSLASLINDHDFAKNEQLNVVGYSHGGNVAIEASNLDLSHKIDNLVTIGTPVRPDYQPNANQIGNHVNAYSSLDVVQDLLGGNIGVYYPEFGPAGRTYPNAKNINVMYETSPWPLESHVQLPNPSVWSRVDAWLR